ncbi:MAG: Ribosomal large subunit pseudouridine synthase D [bacterium ADurb.Bin212]|nr:MAG: Ribosomal large subunit pseudouridine synthase D [bacterium ADurb.Bin212]
MNKTSVLIIDDNNSGLRLDIFLSKNHPDISRASIQAQIKEGSTSVNGNIVRPSYILKAGDKVISGIHQTTIDQDYALSNYDMPLDILFEDSDLIVLNKPPGISVHTSQNEKEKTLVNALINYYPAISKVNDTSSTAKSIFRPGIVHRLDKETSGVMVVAKNIKTLEYLQQIIKNRQIKKQYLALCYGWPNSKTGKLINYLGRKNNNRKVFTEVGVIHGKLAISYYKIIQYFLTDDNKRFSLIEFDILTGRTHQIRSQSLLNGFPVLGDKYYFTKESKEISKRIGIERQALHSWKLSFIPPGESENKEYVAPLATDISTIISKHKPY